MIGYYIELYKTGRNTIQSSTSEELQEYSFLYKCCEMY